MKLNRQYITSYKMVYGVVKKGKWLWKKEEPKWMVVAVIQREYISADGTTTRYEQQESTVECFAELDKHYAIKLMCKLNDSIDNTGSGWLSDW